MILERIDANFNMIRHAINLEFVNDKNVPNSVIEEDLYLPAAEMEIRQRVPSLANANPPFTAASTLDQIATQLSLTDDEKLSLKLSVVFLTAAKLVFAWSERKSFQAGETTEEMATIDWTERFNYLSRMVSGYLVNIGVEVGSSSFVQPVFEVFKSGRSESGG